MYFISLLIQLLHRVYKIYILVLLVFNHAVFWIRNLYHCRIISRKWAKQSWHLIIELYTVYFDCYKYYPQYCYLYTLATWWHSSVVSANKQWHRYYLMFYYLFYFFTLFLFYFFIYILFTYSIFSILFPHLSMGWVNVCVY